MIVPQVTPEVAWAVPALEPVAMAPMALAAVVALTSAARLRPPAGCTSWRLGTWRLGSGAPDVVEIAPSEQLGPRGATDRSVDEVVLRRLRES